MQACLNQVPTRPDPEQDAWKHGRLHRRSSAYSTVRPQEVDPPRREPDELAQYDELVKTSASET